MIITALPFNALVAEAASVNDTTIPNVLSSTENCDDRTIYTGDIKIAYATVYNGSAQVSDTLAYSISAYARQKYLPNDPTNNLSNVVLRMMKYGDAAIAFAPYNVY